MSSATVAPDFHQALDVHGFLTAEVTFDFIVSVEYLTDLSDFAFRQIAYASIRVDTGLREDFTR